MEIIAAKPNAVGTLSTMSVLFLSLRASRATGTTGLSISKTVQSNVHIPFHLRSKLCSKGFRKPCKLLLTWNALVHKSFIHNADSASPFSRSSPHWIVQLVWMFSIRYVVLKDISVRYVVCVFLRMQVLRGVESPRDLNLQCNRGQGWRCSFQWKSWR